MHLFLLAQSSNALPATFAGLGIFFLLLAFAASIFWIWMIIDCIQNRSLDSGQKLIWLLVIFFLHLLGALIYFFAGRGSRSGAN